MRSVSLAAFAALVAAATVTASVLPTKRDLATVYTKCTVSSRLRHASGNTNLSYATWCMQVKDTVALTFDDGVFIYEDELLPLLANYSAKATFFL